MKSLNATLLISSSNHLIKYEAFYSLWDQHAFPWESLRELRWETGTLCSSDQIIHNNPLTIKHAKRAVSKGRQYFVSWEVHPKHVKSPWRGPHNFQISPPCLWRGVPWTPGHMAPASFHTCCFQLMTDSDSSRPTDFSTTAVSTRFSLLPFQLLNSKCIYLFPLWTI